MFFLKSIAIAVGIVAGWWILDHAIGSYFGVTSEYASVFGGALSGSMIYGILHD